MCGEPIQPYGMLVLAAGVRYDRADCALRELDRESRRAEAEAGGRRMADTLLERARLEGRRAGDPRAEGDV